MAFTEIVSSSSVSGPKGVKTGNWKMREEHVSLERGTIHPRSLVQA